jgi:hypothetical protein
MYLFRTRPHHEQANGADAPFGLQDTHQTSTQEVSHELQPPALQPGQVAEWALGELLIRLCNRGRSLRADPPQVPGAE